MILYPEITRITALAPPARLEEWPLADIFREHRLDGVGSITQQAYRLLRELIVNLRLLPNRMLLINEVSECLGVSKTPIREAFIRLSEDGLVQILPKRGTFVAPIDLQKAFEGYSIRISLESACAGLLARSCDKDAITVLRGELDRQKRCIDAGDTDAFYILDNQYHAIMFEVAGLANTRRLVDNAKAEVDRIKGLKSVYRFCRPDEVLLREHTDLCDAIDDGDEARAHECVQDHLTGMNEAILAIAREEKLWGMVKAINQGLPHKVARLPDLRP